jgi:FG-GAP repeat
MFRYFSVVLLCGFYGFASSAFANSQSTTIPEGFRPHLIHHIQKQASSEYAVESRKASSSNTGYQAKNASHKLALGFGVEGVDVRTEQDSEWRMGMKLSAIGYGEDMQPVASGAMTTSGNRVEFRYGNADSSSEVTEWYLNGPLGLEQGFTLNRPPAGKKQSGSLVLTLTLSGDLTAVLNDDGREVRFQTTPGKTSLRFRDLYVLDATGRQLPSRFILANNGYGIQVDDRSAVYPISIDPLLINQHQKLTASDAALEAEFGVSVSISGDTIVVGARFDDEGSENSGSAYVFVRSGVTWIEQDKLKATDGTAGDNFGGSVAIDGDTVVVGAQRDDEGAGIESGSAYVFVRSVTTWTEEQKLIASDSELGDRFGNSVSISGDTIVVGAKWDDDKGNKSGSAYVFTRLGTTWSQQGDKLTASDGALDDEFGVEVSVSGDIAVVGAFHDDDAGDNSGSAYVFVRSGTTWTEEEKLTASDAGAGDDFGDSVAIDGNTVLVGSPHNNDRGSVYVFVRSGTTWPLEQKLTAKDSVKDDHFGESVAISGDTVVVGANWDGDQGFRSGSAYVFERSGTTWTEEKKLNTSDGVSFDQFGGSVAIDGDTAVMGAQLDDDAGDKSGSAYVHKSGTFVFGGTLSGKIFCDDGMGTGTGEKVKFKKTMTFIADNSQFPTAAHIQIQDPDFPLPFELSGVGLLKNPKSGMLQLFGDDSDGGGSKELSLSGKIKLDKKTGTWKSLNGKFQFQDNGNPVCTLAGKFKAK